MNYLRPTDTCQDALDRAAGVAAFLGAVAEWVALEPLAPEEAYGLQCVVMALEETLTMAKGLPPCRRPGSLAA